MKEKLYQSVLDEFEGEGIIEDGGFGRFTRQLREFSPRLPLPERLGQTYEQHKSLFAVLGGAMLAGAGVIAGGAEAIHHRRKIPATT